MCSLSFSYSVKQVSNTRRESGVFARQQGKAVRQLFQFELESLYDTPCARLTLEASKREGRAVSRAHYLESSVPDNKGSSRCRKLKSLSSSDRETERERERGREGGKKREKESEWERAEERNGRIVLVIPLIRLRRQNTHRPRILSELAGFPDDRAVSDYAPLTSI